MKFVKHSPKIKEMALRGCNSAEIAIAIGESRNYVRQGASIIGVKLQRKRTRLLNHLSDAQKQALKKQVQNDPMNMAQRAVDNLTGE
jgi:hypothetical protein